MYRRLFYFLLLVVVAAGLWIRGSFYLHHVRGGLAGTAGGLLELGYLLTMIALASVIVRSLLRSDGVRREMPVTAGSSERRGASLSEIVVQLQTTARQAFVHRPVLASALLLVAVAAFAGIPIGLLALSTAGGLTAFGPIEWLVVGLAELPVVFFLVLVVIGFRSGTDSSR
jgi:hypothetical protein